MLVRVCILFIFLYFVFIVVCPSAVLVAVVTRFYLLTVAFVTAEFCIPVRQRWREAVKQILLLSASVHISSICVLSDCQRNNWKLLIRN